MFILLNIQQKDWNECLKMFILPPVGARVIGSLHTHTHTHTHTQKKKTWAFKSWIPPLVLPLAVWFGHFT
jgi:hypothetical protein